MCGERSAPQDRPAGVSSRGAFDGVGADTREADTLTVTADLLPPPAAVRLPAIMLLDDGEVVTPSPLLPQAIAVLYREYMTKSVSLDQIRERLDRHGCWSDELPPQLLAFGFLHGPPQGPWWCSEGGLLVTEAPEVSAGG